MTCQAGSINFDVDFIKTPYGECDVNDPTKPFGVMMACEGYSLDRSINEFYKNVIDNKVKTIISFNEEFDD